jgi:predicted hotdog family 3-hydroxylacyl-ACP dehydratase
MRWIDALTGCTGATATAIALFNADDFPVADGAVIETALIECVAQTAAAAMGHRAQARGGTFKHGMLMGVSNFHIHSRPALGKTLHIEVRERKRLGAMLLVSGIVSCNGQMIGSGELSLYAQ